jgi:hypothetical protein
LVCDHHLDSSVVLPVDPVRQSTAQPVTGPTTLRLSRGADGRTRGLFRRRAPRTFDVVVLPDRTRRRVTFEGREWN